MPIPKIIHYCWFGRNPKPALAEKCIQSWRRFCPGYEIVEWNEDNFDVTQNDYCREACEAKKWAFVTDYARLKILLQHGGLYFDTDVEMIRPIDDLLDLPCFMGIERSTRCVEVATGLGLGAQPGHPLLAEMLRDYENIHFLRPDGSLDITTCTVRNTRVLRRHGYRDRDVTQDLAGVRIFASEYFSPVEMESGILRKSKNTRTIHHYSLSWTTEEKRIARKKSLKKVRRANFVHNKKTLPNRTLRALLGRGRYEKLKQTLKKRG